MTIEPFEPYWKEGSDGTCHFPENHKLIYESPLAKVVRVFIAAGQSEPPHTHNLRSIMAVDQPTKINVKLVDIDGREKVVFERTSLQENPININIQHMDPEPYHYVTNLDTKDFLASRIEIKGANYSVEQIHEEREIKINKEQECYVISNTDTALKIYQAVQANFGNSPLSEHQAIDDLVGRPKIWCLSYGTYLIKNVNKETANLINIKAT